MSTLKAMSGFSAVEQLTHMGWSLSVRTYWALAAGAAGVTVLAAFAAGLLLFRWFQYIVPAALASVAPSTQVLSAAAGLGCWIIVAYLGATSLIREALTRRRLLIRYNPNAALLRALDIPLSDVFLVKCLPRTLFSGILALAISASFIVAWHKHLVHLPELQAALLVLPLCTTAAVIWSSSHFARTDLRHSRGQLAAMLAVAAAALGASWLLGEWTMVLLGATPQVFDPLLLGSVIGWVTLALLVPAAVVLLYLTARNVRYLQRDSARPAPAPNLRPGRKLAAAMFGAGPAWWLLYTLFRGIARHGAAGLVTRIAGICTIIAAAVIGFSAGGPGFGFLPDNVAVTRLAAIAVFLLSMTVYEVTDRAIGPSGWMPQFRWCFEAGVNQKHIASIAVVATAAVTAAAVVPLALGALALTGGGAALILIPMAAAAAGATGASLTSSPRRQADGTVESSLVTAIVSVLLSLPVLALLVLPGSFNSLFAVAYTTLLIGVGILCLSRRVKYLPSSSWT